MVVGEACRLSWRDRFDLGSLHSACVGILAQILINLPSGGLICRMRGHNSLQCHIFDGLAPYLLFLLRGDRSAG